MQYNDITYYYENLYKGFDNIKEQVGKSQGTYYNPNTEKGYCTWGWFEDIILNTWIYLSIPKRKVKKN